MVLRRPVSVLERNGLETNITLKNTSSLEFDFSSKIFLEV